MVINSTSLSSEIKNSTFNILVNGLCDRNATSATNTTNQYYNQCNVIPLGYEVNNYMIYFRESIRFIIM